MANERKSANHYSLLRVRESGSQGVRVREGEKASTGSQRVMGVQRQRGKITTIGTI